MKDISNKICRLIRKQIVNGDLPANTKLRSTRKLAESYHVSQATILHVLDLLEKDGLIERFARSGVYIKGSKPDRFEFCSCFKKPRAEEIAEDIISGISQGRYKIGESLPLQKNLQFYYKNSTKTIRQALALVEKEILLHREGSRFIIGSKFIFPNPKSRNRLYIIGEQPPYQRQFAFTHHREFFQAFEFELQKYGITTTDYIDLRKNPNILKEIEVISTAGFYLGYSNLDRINYTQEERIKDFFDIVESFGKVKFPLVIDNYLRDFPRINCKFSSNVYALWCDEFKAGEQVGAYLAFLGHKNIAYFTYGKDPWNQTRFLGLQQSMKKAFQQEVNIQIFRGDFDPAKETAKYNPLTHITPENRKNFNKSMSSIFGGYRFASDPLEESLRLFPFYKDLVKKNMTTYFTQALKIKNITAWVCTGGTSSVIAADFLREKNVDVPENLSLISITNEEKVMDMGITAYDFQRSQAGYIAAHCIIGDLPIKKDKQGLVEYEGSIIVRKSTRRV